MSIINGSSYSVIKLVGTPKQLILPKTNEEGLVERMETVQLEHLLLNHTEEIQIQGCKMNWIYNYARWVLGETLMTFQEIWRHAKGGGGLLLCPRIDLSTRFFQVNYTGDPIDLGIKGGGTQLVKYNRLPVISFRTKYLEPEPAWELTGPAIAAPGGGSILPIEGGM